jgi:hypothetical protein
MIQKIKTHLPTLFPPPRPILSVSRRRGQGPGRGRKSDTLTPSDTVRSALSSGISRPAKIFVKVNGLSPSTA